MVALALAFVWTQSEVGLVDDYSVDEAPCGRMSGVAIQGDQWVLGGIKGLFVGRPHGAWKQVSKKSVREIVAKGNEAWALYGNGSVDKLDVPHDRLYFDVFHGAVKRPWTSSISDLGDGLAFGGMGGWVEKSGSKSLKEMYPAELGKRAITCAAKLGLNEYFGTQDGLFVRSARGIRRLGFADGLTDVWVTSLAVKGSKVLVGTYTGGVLAYDGKRLVAQESPKPTIRHLLVYKGQLVIGSLNGTWIEHGDSWTLLSKLECTFLSQAGADLVVGTPESLRFFR